MYREVVDRSSVRDKTLVLMGQVRDNLTQLGYQPYRVGEFLHPTTGRHVRIGYASDEWTITSGALVGHQVVPDLPIRIDLRLCPRASDLPHVAGLIRTIEGARAVG